MKTRNKLEKKKTIKSRNRKKSDKEEIKGKYRYGGLVMACVLGIPHRSDCTAATVRVG